MVAFCQDLEELKQFVTLNHTAILKVLKKAEKKMDTPLMYVGSCCCSAGSKRTTQLHRFCCGPSNISRFSRPRCTGLLRTAFAGQVLAEKCSAKR